MAGGLAATAIWLPGAFGVITVIAYLVGADGSVARDYAAAIGLAGAFVLWLLAGFSLRSFASVAHANGTSFDLIAERLERLRSRVPPAPPSGEQGSAEDGAVGAARGHIDAINALLGIRDGVRASSASKDQLDRSVRWVLGTGYVDLWRRIHLAEEALILAPDAEPVAEATEALERITDSGLKTAASLSYRLRVAARVVDKGLGPYLRSLEAPATGPSDDEITKAAEAICAGSSDARARGLEVIKEVRHTVNSFRDTRWEGLVHARNRLVKSTLLVGAMGCAVLALAVILHVPPDALVAAVVFYLVGGLVGLFARLRTDAEASTAVDDYGLSTVTLINTPLVSGLAAVAGVVLTSLLASSAVTASIVPPPAGGAATVAGAIPDLSAIFTLGSVGLLVAGIFGASPGLLMSRLQAQANRFKEDIARTERAGTEEGTAS